MERLLVTGKDYASNCSVFVTQICSGLLEHMYGYVTPSDVLELIDTQIGKGEVIERLWRGKMGVAVKEAEKVEKPKVANGTGTNNHEQQPQEVGTGETTKTVGGCCQGANGFSCCMNEVVEKTDKEQQGLSAWTGKWEQRQVLTTVAVVGAVATIAVTYGVYHREYITVISNRKLHARDFIQMLKVI
ncbi:uncharacterized protein LOC121749104 [Salvia splendens]|uniref:uncharacterized protein LOC121749104 n=1 Tax=Salvia splendens TaxID=180675 RepID=UPI001C255F35|nr:uncharacterized protein LOC121749104 [Salvia splendens]